MVNNNDSINTEESTVETVTLKIPVKATKANLIEIIKSKDERIAELEESWTKERYNMGRTLTELTRCQAERNRYQQTVETLLEYIKEAW